MPQANPLPNRLILGRVFDSAHPVRSREELLGRRRELDELLAATLDFGQHAIVHGARGSGKTSLVRIFGDHADQGGAVVIYMACEPGVSFSELILPYLRAIPTAALRPGAREAFARGLDALPATFGPRAVVELVAEQVSSPVLFILDEFDRITDTVVKADIAAAMKLLSDALATVLFVLVGIARDVSDVVDAHPSLRRHLRTVALGRIEPTSVDALITNGAAAAGLVFDDRARAVIARASCGSPFHVRIFAHHSALAAVRDGSSVVREADARTGLKTALEHWASMNHADAATFVRLVETGQNLHLLERTARRAAVNDRLEQDGSAETAHTNILADAVRAEPGMDTALVFRDSVAPQFLIAFIMLAEVSAPASVPTARQELPDAVDS
ncbi:ATP-binding protein [Sphingomonas qilianensis]|uniref:ATP-binding protein n=1 Tax=Sphingomonas qilianensis TaxID=1736690 RepID=UPI0036D3AB69